MQGNGYDLADSGLAIYFGELLQRLIGAAVKLDLAEPWHRPGPVFGDPRLAPYRLGQQAFKAVVMDAYHRQSPGAAGRPAEPRVPRMAS